MKQFRFFLILTMLAFNLPPETMAGNDSTWVDSVYRSLTVEQRLAQLMVLRGYSCLDSVYNDSLTSVIRKINPGGICFFKGTPWNQATLTNRFQAAAQTPLLIAIDAEWGLGMRLDSCIAFPRQMALGAIRDDSLIYAMGTFIGRSCRRIGVHINFAPVVDINNNPANPVIGFRSFGEKPGLVTRKGLMYMKGLQDQGIMATPKHFPGHGDTDTDSHFDLPVIRHSQSRLDSVELAPFKALIREGAQGIMVAHLYMPAFDTSLNTSATLSYNVVTKLLREQLGFKGFAVTDALDMKGVTKFFKPGEIEINAFNAGNDILLLPQDALNAVGIMKTALDSSRISEKEVEIRCKRILHLKYRMGLNHPAPVNRVHLTQDLNVGDALALQNMMVGESLTLVKNEIQIIPLTNLDSRKIAVLSAGDTSLTHFQQTVKRYGLVDCYSVPKYPGQRTIDSIARIMNSYDIVLIGIHNITSNATEGYGISENMIALIDSVLIRNRTILTFFGTPYSLIRIPNVRKAEAILIAYQDNLVTEKAAASALFGGIPVQGTLPVTTDGFSVGTCESTEKSRMGFAIPEELGIPAEALGIVDSIASSGITHHAYPGCQVLLAKNGRIFYEKAFGNLQYNDSAKVTLSHLYDIASVTKVAATTLAVMKLFDDNRISLDDTLGKYLPVVKGSNKSRLVIRDILAHQAGLQDWIPFYQKTIKNGAPDPLIYQSVPSGQFPWKVAGDLFMRNDYRDTILRQIITSPLRSSKDYKYSDLGFYLLMLMVEQVSGESFENFVMNHFYRPLGLQRTGFNPLRRTDPAMVAPTEKDESFRKQTIRGYVHDPGAAMMGGVCGHAGLFSDSYDLAVIMQMLLQEGFYGGRYYFSPATVREFTRYQYPGLGNRRGAGFDKPLLKNSASGPSCGSASYESYGHSGFTGTYIWADPCNELVYVFLSNRISPKAENQTLSSLNIRTNLHQAVYDLFEKYRVK